MSGLREMVLLCEIGFQSQIALRAGERLKATENSSDRLDVWSSIQTILIATGIVSRILWPTNKKNENRGKILRKILKVDENNILSDRTFRNHFEHYEERIEEWFQNHPTEAYVDLAMNPSLSGTIENCHRGYNSFNKTLVFRGKLLDLNQILKALEDISKNPYTFTFV